MLRLGGIMGSMTDARIAGRMHELEHAGRVEQILLFASDTRRHRLHTMTDRGTECAIALPRSERLFNGAVLLLEADRAIVVRLREEEWLTLAPRDAPAALELGYLAGNMHWSVRFGGTSLQVLLGGPRQDYLDRLAPLVSNGRVRIGEGGEGSDPAGDTATCR